MRPVLLLILLAGAGVAIAGPTGVGDRSEPSPWFEDIAARAGLTARHISSPEKRYIIESMSGGAGVLDYDDDGRLDIVLVNGSNVERYRKGGDRLVTLYRQVGDLRFEDVTEQAGLTRRGWGMGVAAADFDNDGHIDLYVTGYGGNVLYRNRGDGTFEDVTERAGVGAGGFSAGAAWGDYDRDGHVDLFVARYVQVDMDDLPEFGRDEFCRFRGILVQCGPGGMTGETDLLFRNRGDGTFEEVSVEAGVHGPERYYGLGAVWADYDDDGWPDLFVANDATPNYLYRNRGDGTFEEVALLAGVALSGDGAPQGCMGVDVGDYDRDGRLDLFSTNFSEQPNVLYRNLGAEGFADVSWASRSGPPGFFLVGWGTAFFDFDHDGWPDLLTVNGHVYPQIEAADVGTTYRQPMLLQRNSRDGTFEDVTETSGLASLPLASRRGAAFGDLDNDGALDVVVLNVDETPTVLHNRNRDGQRVLFRLVGTRSNRSAIGARVTVRTGDFSQIDEVRGGASYLSHNDLRLHFGLGDARRIDAVDIRWPDGTREELTDLEPGRLYTILEGKGIQAIQILK
jgi:enediyne biosynthesis protein E4